MRTIGYVIISLLVLGILGCKKEVTPIDLQLELLSDSENLVFIEDTLFVPSIGSEESVVFAITDANGQDFGTSALTCEYSDGSARDWCETSIKDKRLLLEIWAYDDKEAPRFVKLTVGSDVSIGVNSVEFVVCQLPKPKMNEARICSFEIESQVSDAQIDEEDKTIVVKVDKEADLNGLIPTIQVSEGASISPESGEPQDFTEIVNYLVTAEDGETSVEYQVIVEKSYGPNADKAEFVSFNVEGQFGETVIDHDSRTVTLNVSEVVDITNVIPDATISEGATVVPSLDEARDFSSPVEYTITSEDGSSVNTYEVIISSKKSSEALLVSLIVGDAESGDLVVEADIDHEESVVRLQVPYSDDWPWSYYAHYTDVVSYGATGRMDFNNWDFSFRSGGSYTVTSEDGENIKVYEVIAEMDLNPNAELNSFVIYDPETNGRKNGIYSALVDNQSKTVDVKIKEGADISNVYVKLSVSEGATTNIQEGSPINLSSPFVLSITSENGENTTNYTVVTSILNIDNFDLGMVDVLTGETFVFGGNTNENYVRDYAQDVTLTKDFSIGKYEITQDIFEAVMGFNDSPTKGDNYPISNINWYEAADFCNRLSELYGLEPVYEFIQVEYNSSNNRIESAIVKYNHDAAEGYRLPTNAEFEWAAKGGTVSKGYVFSGGNDPKEVAWYEANTSASGNNPREVGGKLPNELGLYDMSGNVDEWVYDWHMNVSYGEIPDYDEYNPIGGSGPDGFPGWNDYKIFRGGSASSSMDVISVSKFRFTSPSDKYSDLGFRIAISK